MEGIQRRLRQPHRIVVCVNAVGKVDAMHIIDEPVAVVIHAVARNFALIGPHVGEKIFVTPFSTSVHNCYNDPWRTALTLDRIPGFRKTQVPEIHLLAEPGIVGDN